MILGPFYIQYIFEYSLSVEVDICLFVCHALFVRLELQHRRESMFYVEVITYLYELITTKTCYTRLFVLFICYNYIAFCVASCADAL